MKQKLPQLPGLENIPWSEDPLDPLPVQEDIGFTDTSPRRIGQWKKTGALALAGIITLVGGYKVGDALLSHDQAPIVHRANEGGDDPSLLQTHESTAERAEVQVFDEPFEPLGGWTTEDLDHRAELERRKTELGATMDADPAAGLGLISEMGDILRELEGPEKLVKDIETKDIKFSLETIERFDAEFMTAIKLSSGMRFNIYGANQDPSADVKVNPKALDQFVNNLLEEAKTATDSSYKDKGLSALSKAKEGELDDTLVTLIIGDKRDTCIPDTANGGFVDLTVVQLSENATARICGVQDEDDNTRQEALGVATSHRGPSRSKNISVVISAPGGSMYTTVEPSPSTGDNLFYGYMLAHELLHGVVAHETLENTGHDSDAEHSQFVVPVSESYYEKFAQALENGEVEAPISLITARQTLASEPSKPQSS